MSSYCNNANSIKEYFLSKDIGAEAEVYIKYHCMRYVYLINKITFLRSTFKRSIGVLDVGPSFFTELLMLNLNEDNILSLGLDLPEERGGHFPEVVNYNKANHYYFDLNNCVDTAKWITVPTVDIIVLAEVIEHLYISPLFVLKFLCSILSEEGYIVIQTPNAVSLMSRIRMLLGRNPAEMIRENIHNPGHYREYTMSELTGLSKSAGYAVPSKEYCYYYKHDGIYRTYDYLLKILPGSFSDSITIIFKKHSITA